MGAKRSVQCYPCAEKFIPPPRPETLEEKCDRLASELQVKTDELARVRPLLEEITEDLERFESAELLAMVPRTCEAIREFTTRSRSALERKEEA